MTTETTDNTETSTEDASGLKNKNRELHGIIKKLEAQVSKLTDDVEEAADNARAETGTELDKANRQITKLTKERDEALTRADESDKGLREFRASNALTTAIAAANVHSEDVALVSKALRADVEFDDNGEPTIEGKSIESYTKSFFASAGKKYVRAADHDGGGASGSDGSKATRWSKLPQTQAEWAEFNSLDTAERNAVADGLGAPQLKV